MVKDNKWTYEIEVTLIEFYRTNPLMWDRKHPDHKIVKKSILLDELSHVLDDNFTIEEIRKRFANLRTTFQANYKRAIKSKASCTGSEATFVPSFQHYNALYFLLDSTDADDSTSTTQLPTSTPPPDNERTVDEFYVNKTMGILELRTDTDEELVECPASPSDSSNIGKANVFEGVGQPMVKKRRSTAVSNGDLLLKQAEATIEALKRMSERRDVPSPDEASLLGSHVTLATRQMDPWSRSLASIEIHQILAKYSPNNPNRPTHLDY